jgi:hypothetical protein
MGNKKRDPLKSLIRKVEPDTPSLNFTDLVMEEVQAQEPVINPALKALLKRNGIENPSSDLTHRILAHIEAQGVHTTYKPIITKKAWSIITAAVVLFVTFLGYSDQTSKSPEGLTPFFISIGHTLNAVVTNTNTTPSLYLLTFISIGVLLVMDYLLTGARSHETKSSS